MNYTVFWPAAVRQQLLDLYAQTVQGTGRETAELNAALAAVDDALRRTPTVAGESREGDRRVIIAGPLSVKFRVLEDQRRVEVISASYSRGKRP